MSIKRFDEVYEDEVGPDRSVQEVVDGRYVLYSDHAAELANSKRAVLNQLWETVNALGGRPTPGDLQSLGYVEGIGEALAAIEAAGGRDPLQPAAELAARDAQIASLQKREQCLLAGLARFASIMLANGWQGSEDAPDSLAWLEQQKREAVASERARCASLARATYAARVIREDHWNEEGGMGERTSPDGDFMYWSEHDELLGKLVADIEKEG